MPSITGNTRAGAGVGVAGGKVMRGAVGVAAPAEGWVGRCATVCFFAAGAGFGAGVDDLFAQPSSSTSAAKAAETKEIFTSDRQDIPRISENGLRAWRGQSRRKIVQRGKGGS
jgi:hypothetical protein